jgi:hypothetical protein
VEGRLSIAAENPPASSQHGELRLQSAQNVCVGDGVKGLGKERQLVA